MFVSDRAKVEPGVSLGEGVVILGPTTIEDDVIVEDHCIIGKPSTFQSASVGKRPGQSTTFLHLDSLIDTATVIRRGCRIGRLSTVYSGAILHEGVVCLDYTTVGWDTEIGAGSQLMFRAQVCSWVRVADHCRIGGFCCNDSRLGRRVSMYGHLAHAYREYGGGRREDAPRLEDDVTVGFGAQIIGGVVVGCGSYVAAGSIVTKDVPPHSVVTGVNRVCSLRSWRGRLRTTRLLAGSLDR